MTDLVITSVRIVESIEQFDLPEAEALAPGNAVRINTTDGKATGANGTTLAEAACVGVIAEEDEAGAVVTIIKQGLLDVGEALAALDYGDPVYLSDTDKTLADAAGTVEKEIGYVAPGWGATTADKLLRVHIGASIEAEGG